MKQLRRLDLSPQTLSFLNQRAGKVAAAADPRSEAARLWNHRSNNAFREIRTVLSRMASGSERCMYCEDSEGTAIDHFWPKTDYPGRAFDWLNYLIACSGCNSNFKRDQFPLDSKGLPLLINPTEDEPLDHLYFSPSTGKYLPRSSKGQPSIDIFGLDRATLTAGRLRAWRCAEQLLIRYAQQKAAGRDIKAAEIQHDLLVAPFAGVFIALLRIAAGPDAEFLIDHECLQVLRANPEIQGWV